MDNKIRMLAYPFTEKNIPIIDYIRKYSDEFEISELIALNGTGVVGKDASCLDNRYNMGIIVKNQLEENLGNCDAVLILSGEENDDDLWHRHVPEAIQLTLNEKKDLYCAMKIEQDEVEHWEKAFQEQGKKFCYLGKTPEYLKKQDKYIGNPLYIPKATIIFTAGLYSDSNVCDSALVIVEGLRKKGFKVSCLSSENEAPLLKMFTLPKFITDFQKGFSQNDIKLFNSYLHIIDETEMPDVIVIQLPGNLMAFNDMVSGDFGLSSYVVMQAVKPDYFHLCIANEGLIPELLKGVSERIRALCGYDVDSIHLSNEKEIPSPFLNESSYYHTHVTMNKVEEKIVEFTDVTLYNVLNPQSAEQLCENIINTLVG